MGSASWLGGGGRHALTLTKQAELLHSLLDGKVALMTLNQLPGSSWIVVGLRL